MKMFTKSVVALCVIAFTGLVSAQTPPAKMWSIEGQNWQVTKHCASQKFYAEFRSTGIEYLNTMAPLKNGKDIAKQAFNDSAIEVGGFNREQCRENLSLLAELHQVRIKNLQMLDDIVRNVKK